MVDNNAGSIDCSAEGSSNGHSHDVSASITMNNNSNNNNNQDSNNYSPHKEDTSYHRDVPSSSKPQRQQRPNNNKESVEMATREQVQGSIQHQYRISVYDLLDYTSKPWVLVPNGSYGGHFDFVPQSLRIGPWSTSAYLYFCMIWYCTLLTGCYYYHNYSSNSDSTPNTTSSTTRDWINEISTMGPLYPSQYTIQWYYHLLGGMWMIYIIYVILFHSPLSFRAWATYTVQSWTLLAIRHVLCAMIPIVTTTTNSTVLIYMVEIIRFPCAVAHTVTFTIWNFVLVPYLLLVVFRHDSGKQQQFIAFCTNFRLSNLHLLNIVLCLLNIGPFGSPRRKLYYVDLYLATLSAVIYLTWYTCILDRIGVHLYPVFSPRLSNGLVLLTWSGAALLYVIAFHAWRQWLWPI